ncbi:MAG TPA: IS1595 family transposase [Erysipelotrichaceae bacterium]|nr:IS1595 family transposase [Erysipelotrichaceae bacterium]
MIKYIKEMTIEDLKNLDEEIKIEMINRFVESDLKETLEELSFDNYGKFICKHCSSTNTKKAGFNSQGKQRFKCKDCNKHMSQTTGLVNFSSKKSFNHWVICFESVLAGDTLEITAFKANISVRTAFRWRHKLLYVINTKLNKKVLSGVVTLDETMFPVVFKNKNNPNDTITIKRGMSNQKINVTCAIDSNKNTIIKVVDRGRVSAEGLIAAYESLIKENSIVVSDSLRSYHRLMDRLNVRWMKIPSKKKSINEFTLDPINHVHASLKDFIYKYKGISIKYLQGYCALFDYVRYNKKFYEKEHLFDLIKDIFSIKCHISCELLDSNSMIYL